MFVNIYMVFFNSSYRTVTACAIVYMIRWTQNQSNDNNNSYVTRHANARASHDTTIDEAADGTTTDAAATMLVRALPTALVVINAVAMTLVAAILLLHVVETRLFFFF